jgi:hypothetical protein
MNLVYKFFGIGNNFIKMLNTISTGRTASIILEEGELSPPFQLGTGFLQGNAPSPNQFNIGDQILIFKIELSQFLTQIRITPVGRCRYWYLRQCCYRYRFLPPHVHTVQMNWLLKPINWRHLPMIIQ